MFFKALFSSFLKKTPWFLKGLLFLLVATSLTYSLFASLAPFFTQNILHPLLGLSWEGLHQGFFWQLFTSFLIQPSYEGFSFGFLFFLLIKLYLLWFLALSMIEYKGQLPFFLLYLFSALGGVGLVLLALPYGSYSKEFMNILGPIYGLMISWLMLYPNGRIFLFSYLPIKASSFLGWIFLTHLLMDLTEGQVIHVAYYLGCSLTAYLYTLFIWRCRSPVAFLSSLESFCLEKTTFLKRKIFYKIGGFLRRKEKT